MPCQSPSTLLSLAAVYCPLLLRSLAPGLHKQCQQRSGGRGSGSLLHNESGGYHEKNIWSTPEIQGTGVQSSCRCFYWARNVHCLVQFILMPVCQYGWKQRQAPPHPRVPCPLHRVFRKSITYWKLNSSCFGAIADSAAVIFLLPVCL